MNAVTKIKEPSATSIAVIVEREPAIVLLDADKAADLYAHIRQEIAEFVPDLTTVKGREAIKSLAYKIVRTKTAIDAAGKLLNEEARSKINVVDAARRDAKATLDAMAEEVRRPLTEWEDAEKARIAARLAEIENIRSGTIISEDDTSETVRARRARIADISIDENSFGDLSGEAEGAKLNAINTLDRALARLVQEEANREELARLREAEERRIEEEAKAAAAQEAARKEAEDLRLSNERRAAAEKVELERIQREREETAQAAREEVERKAREEREALQRETEIAEGKRRYARQIIAHIQEVGLGMIGGQPQPYGILLRELTDKITIDDQMGDMQGEVRAVRDATLKSVEAAMERANERHQREEEEGLRRKAAEEDAARAANKAHRASVKTAAKQAIMTCGASEETAQKIVIAILAGEVPAVTLAF